MRKNPNRMCRVWESVRQWFGKLPNEIKSSPTTVIGLCVGVVSLLGLSYLSILVALSVVGALLLVFFAVHYLCRAMARRTGPEFREKADRALQHIRRMLAIRKYATRNEIIDVLLDNGFDYELAEEILNYLIESGKLQQRRDGCVCLTESPGDTP
ncbi:MAG: hypothetical protein BECKG1743D_GA0114223_101576 [Candidatus Kentron sp. G]|nr:MAG: hypothetical protein BECKG1743F_GA0114225_100457 [Candidatus Kentron sp. G]VFM97562.1 MAG: hypothetical protein BECKG1743E_GA0114224_101386 [Candidatus Kentron sp. G]VFM99929.1 MAG: hypothetical protein BECKG1743D_GA0114223_101576 [Candidatus Kentron sp. G]